jgi:hypothetical protein
MSTDVRRCPDRGSKRANRIGAAPAKGLQSPGFFERPRRGHLGRQHSVRRVYVSAGALRSGADWPIPDLAAEPRRRSGGQGTAVGPCRRQPRRGDLDRSDDDAIMRASPEALGADDGSVAIRIVRSGDLVSMEAIVSRERPFRASQGTRRRAADTRRGSRAGLSRLTMRLWRELTVHCWTPPEAVTMHSWPL